MYTDNGSDSHNMHIDLNFESNYDSKVMLITILYRNRAKTSQIILTVDVRRYKITQRALWLASVVNVIKSGVHVTKLIPFCPIALNVYLTYMYGRIGIKTKQGH